jgi:hypothetical protein
MRVAHPIGREMERGIAVPIAERVWQQTDEAAIEGEKEARHDRARTRLVRALKVVRRRASAFNTSRPSRVMANSRRRPSAAPAVGRSSINPLSAALRMIE